MTAHPQIRSGSKALGPLLNIVVLSLTLQVHAQTAAGPPATNAAESARVKIEAEQRVRSENVAFALANFERTGNPGMLMTITELGLPPQEAVPIWADLLHHDLAGARSIALHGLGQYHAHAAPTMPRVIELLDDPDEWVFRHAAELVVKVGPPGQAAIQPLIARLARGAETDPPAVHQAGIRALAHFGEAAEAALPVLDRYVRLSNSETAFETFLAAGEIRNEGPLVPRTAEDLTGPEGFRAFEAIQLGFVNRTSAIGFLQEVIQGEATAPPVLAMAIETLGQLMPSDPQSANLILTKIEAKDDFISDTAAKAMNRFASSDKTAIDKLVVGLSSQSTATAQSAAKSIVRFGTEAFEAVPHVVKLLQESSGRTHYARVGAYLDVLRAAGSESNAARTLVTEMLAVDHPIYQGRPTHHAYLVRRYAMLTLADIGPDARAVPHIADMLANDQGPGMIGAAARAAARLDGDRAVFVPFLLRPLRPDFYDMLMNDRPIDTLFWIPKKDRMTARLEAIRALADIGPPAKAALPLLKARANDAPVTTEFYVPYREDAEKAIEAISK